MNQNPPTATLAAVKPEFYRLPSRGVDPHFGLSRSTYYALEAEGKLQMKRLRASGSVKGIVMVPYAAMVALIEREGSAA
jgi:hypothetical protein